MFATSPASLPPLGGGGGQTTDVTTAAVNVNANATWLINGTYRFGTGSLHTGNGTNAAFADGHVQWIIDNIDGSTWETLGGMADSGVDRNGIQAGTY